MEKLKQELTNLRNSFYDSMPSGETVAWDWVQWASKMFKEFDEYIDRPAPLTGTVDESAKWDQLEEKIMKIEHIIDEIEIDSEGLFSSNASRNAAIKIISLLSKQPTTLDESKGLKSKEEIVERIMQARQSLQAGYRLGMKDWHAIYDEAMDEYASQFKSPSSNQGLVEALEKIRDMLYDASNYSHCCYSFKSKQELLSIVKEAIVQHNTLPPAPSLGVEEAARKWADNKVDQYSISPHDALCKSFLAGAAHGKGEGDYAMGLIRAMEGIQLLECETNEQWVSEVGEIISNALSNYRQLNNQSRVKAFKDFLHFMEHSPHFYMEELRRWINQYSAGQISISKFLELINERLFELLQPLQQPNK